MNNEQLESEFEAWYMENQPSRSLFSNDMPWELTRDSIKLWAKHAFFKSALLVTEGMTERFGV